MRLAVGTVLQIERGTATQGTEMFSCPVPKKRKLRRTQTAIATKVPEVPREAAEPCPRSLFAPRVAVAHVSRPRPPMLKVAALLQRLRPLPVPSRLRQAVESEPNRSDRTDFFHVYVANVTRSAAMFTSTILVTIQCGDSAFGSPFDRPALAGNFVQHPDYAGLCPIQSHRHAPPMAR